MLSEGELRQVSFVSFIPSALTSWNILEQAALNCAVFRFFRPNCRLSRLFLQPRQWHGSWQGRGKETYINISFWEKCYCQRNQGVFTYAVHCLHMPNLPMLWRRFHGAGHSFFAVRCQAALPTGTMQIVEVLRDTLLLCG